MRRRHWKRIRFSVLRLAFQHNFQDFIASKSKCIWYFVTKWRQKCSVKLFISNDWFEYHNSVVKVSVLWLQIMSLILPVDYVHNYGFTQHAICPSGTARRSCSLGTNQLFGSPTVVHRKYGVLLYYDNHCSHHFIAFKSISYWYVFYFI